MNDFPVQQLFSVWCDRAGLDTKQHQLEGIEWVINRERNPTLGSAGGFICDEMGLGKTILMLGTIYSNLRNGYTKTLIVVPPALFIMFCYEKASQCAHRIKCLCKVESLCGRGLCSHGENIGISCSFQKSQSKSQNI